MQSKVLIGELNYYEPRKVVFKKEEYYMRIVFVVSNSVGLKHEQLKRSKKMRWRLFGFNLFPAGGGGPLPTCSF